MWRTNGALSMRPRWPTVATVLAAIALPRKPLTAVGASPATVSADIAMNVSPRPCDP